MDERIAIEVLGVLAAFLACVVMNSVLFQCGIPEESSSIGKRSPLENFTVSSRQLFVGEVFAHSGGPASSLRALDRRELDILTAPPRELMQRLLQRRVQKAKRRNDVLDYAQTHVYLQHFYMVII